MTTTSIDAATSTAHMVVSQDGAKISYLTLGHGPAVIVIPGALSLAADYAAFGRALAEQFTVHIIERRGRGQSSPQGADYSIQKECEDVLALQRQTGASGLVGHSFGGFVALEVARNNPSFTNVAVYEPGVSIEGSIPAGWMPRFSQKLAEQKNLDAFVEFVRGINPESSGKLPPWLMKFMLLLFMSSHERKQKLDLLHECLREHQEEVRLDGSYENYREIEASVLLMYGGKSYNPRLQRTMERLAAVIPRTETHTFPKLDHFGIDQGAPQEVARVVGASFLREQATPPLR
ncbi:alpha/beta fold hydrolase [Ktedonospora formicarum]|uniref:Alpha/beta hydrolase n=1 Tax=Ktedonospora formicarum TaxID=2778364 RepID=A0A8J3MUW7_9CHLR|nr:alpha/beta hydrolase [Ktedonospora formicarum]GHO47023.1 alpha/beta hydrolase [Ktedonospora formicarum]